MTSLDTGARRCLLGLSLAASASLLPTAQAASLRIGSVESIAPIEVSAPRAAAADAAVAGRRELRFDAFGRRFDLLLEANRTFASRPSLPESVEGTAAGLTGSWVRLTKVGGAWVGVVFDGVEYFAFDTAGGVAPFNETARRLPGAVPVAYRLRDTMLSDISFGVDGVARPGTLEQALGAVSTEVAPAVAAATLATKRLDVGVVVDAEQVAHDQQAGQDPAALAVARFAVIDNIFSTQVGVHIVPGTPVLLTAGSQPFDTTDAEALLDELGNYRRGDARQQAAGLTHLFTGRDISFKGSATTVGIAYTSSLCQKQFAASLSEATQSSLVASLIAAHEIGHAFGAPHDGDSAKACASTPTTFLMAPQLNGSQTFSDCSLAQMQPVVAAASCLAPVDAPDAALGAPASQRIAVGQASLLHVTVRSSGNAAVSNVQLTANLPAGVTVQGAGATTGATCPDVQPGQVHCLLGTMAAGTSHDIEITLVAAAAGNSQATLQISADNDALADDDSATVRLTAAAGADLGVSVTFDPATVQQSATTTAHVVVRNSGLANATDAALSITTDPGLVPVSTGGAGPACTIASGAATCTPFALAAGTSAELLLTLQAGAATTGAQKVTLHVGSATLVEPQPGNNDAVGAVTVTAPAPPPPPPTPASSGGGGGGRLDVLALLGLALGAFLACTARLRRQTLHG